jgi:uroporphyrinogen III methyltransferase/synthase
VTLAGRRILVTRARQQAGPLSELLKAAGAEVIEVALIEFEAVDAELLAHEVERLGAYALLVLTSVNALRALVAIPGFSVALSGPVRPRILAVGPATAAALAGEGLPCDGVASQAGAAGLAELLEGTQLRDARVLFPRAAEGREELVDWLRSRGAEVVLIDAYRTVAAAGSPKALKAALESGLDMLTFASPSAVESFVAGVGPSWKKPPGLAVACIGPTTAAVARAAGLEPDVVAAESTAEGLSGAIVDHYSDVLS